MIGSRWLAASTSQGVDSAYYMAHRRRAFSLAPLLFAPLRALNFGFGRIRRIAVHQLCESVF